MANFSIFIYEEKLPNYEEKLPELRGKVTELKLHEII